MLQNHVEFLNYSDLITRFVEYRLAFMFTCLKLLLNFPGFRSTCSSIFRDDDKQFFEDDFSMIVLFVIKLLIQTI